ncbi:MAG: glycerate kinase [Elusimicrobia bacterium]|nr:glycerate kinase [Elusimicrobiota bacterium]
MKVLVAPNAFKGSLSCVDAARALARGVRAVFKDAEIVSIPVADGGDGLIDALKVAMGGAVVSAPARGPLGERRRASYLWNASKKLAVIEMARASGLALVPPGKRRPMDATSRGTGDLIRDAVRRGARTVIVGLGGTASSDGGAGMARALGARLLDCEGRELPDGVVDLPRLCSVDAGAVRSLLSGVKVVALSDVTNPLLGPKGSARVFGPQKGATPAQVRKIEEALAVWAVALCRDLKVCVASKPGAGAAGGLGAGLLAFAGAELVPGADWILEKTGALKALKSADLALTAEGRLDKTSLFGKAPVVLARAARKAGVPCVAVAGQVSPAAFPFKKTVSFQDAGARSLADSMSRASHWAAKAAALAVSGLAVCAVLVLPARANKILAPESFDAQYYQRHLDDNLAKNIAGLQDALKSEVIGESETWKAPYLWRLCRAKIRLSEKKEKRSDKLALYESAKADCEKSVALSSQTADGHFWLGVAIGRWGETKGLMKALFIIKPLKKEMAEVIRLDPSHGGAHNVLAEILWQVPGFVGGDKRKALEEFETALRLSPRYTANHQPLAEAYLHYGRKDDAIRVLRLVEATKDPADPAEYPENLADAKKLLSKLESAK